VKFVAAQLTFLGTVLFWPAFFVGSFILHLRGKSKHTLWMLVGATTACLGAAIRFVSQFAAVSPPVKSADAISSAPDIYFVGLIIRHFVLDRFGPEEHMRVRWRGP
jgi:hypothetical protein